MDDPSNKHFRIVPFSVHATRGLLRDQKARRKAIGISLVVAVAMLTAGLTVLRSWLDAHEHPWRFVLFWFACAWVTILVLLLALFDLLLVRAQGRAERKAIREQFSRESRAGSPSQSDL
jgi:hypothetical protein